jgi:hypothetical protein
MYFRFLIAQAGIAHGEFSGGEDHLAVDVTVHLMPGGVRVQIKTGTKAPNNDGSITVPVTEERKKKWAVSRVPVFLVYVHLETAAPAEWIEHEVAHTTVYAQAQCTLAIGWAVSHAAPVGEAQARLLGAAAASMGLQGAAMRGLGVTLETTYLTGTLTGLIAARAQVPRARSDAAGIASLIAAVGGAACGGLMLMSSASATPLLCVGPVSGVIATAEWRRHRSADFA